MSVTILIGDVRAKLAELPTESVHCIWTSVPYWGLRSYGTEPQVWGDDPIDCEHEWSAPLHQPRNGAGRHGATSQVIRQSRAVTEAQVSGAQATKGAFCHICGAWRGEHGLEPSLEMWLRHEVLIWRELRRVLRKDGTAWLNCGDAYATSPNGRSVDKIKELGTDNRTFRDKPVSTVLGSGLKSKQRLMMPARLAIALQDDGWWIRDEIVWAKPNPMPSSVKDRTTPAHEMLYLLTRSAKYYFDAEAIKEPASLNTHARTAGNNGWKTPDGWDTSKGEGGHGSIHRSGREKGRKGSQGKNEDSPDRRRSGFNERWDAKERKLAEPGSGVKNNSSMDAALAIMPPDRNKRSVWTIATEPYPGAHFATAPTALVEPCIKAGCPADGVVLDPFMGSGTTCLVAHRLQRRSIGIELNPEYAAQARERIAGDAPLLTEIAHA